MKQICLIFLLFVLLAACTVPPAQQESCPSANLEDMDNPIDSAIKENTVSSEYFPALPEHSEPTKSPVSFPNFNEFEIPSLDTDMESIYFTDLPLEYTVYNIPKDFLKDLKQLDVHALNSLSDVTNFFKIEEYIVYYLVSTDIGPSWICLKSADERPVPIFYCSQPIKKLAFWDQKTLLIELAYHFHMEGYYGQWYLFDLENASVPLLPNGKTIQGLSFNMQSYHQKFYLFSESRFSKGLGEAWSIEVQDDSKTFERILEYAPAAKFLSGKIFYLSPDRKSILTCDLYGRSQQTVYQSEEAIWDFQISKNKLSYQIPLSSTNFVLNLSQEGNKPIECDGQVFLQDDGFYCLNPNGSLNYINNQGTPLEICSEIPMPADYYVVENDVFFVIHTNRKFIYVYFDTEKNQFSQLK